MALPLWERLTEDEQEKVSDIMDEACMMVSHEKQINLRRSYEANIELLVKLFDAEFLTNRED